MSGVQALATAVGDELEGMGLGRPQVRLERPARPEHGDWATTVALEVAKQARRSPREIASELAARLERRGLENVAGIEVAGPGFVNFRVSPGWFHSVLEDVVTQGEEGYASCGDGAGERVQIEFVSANPTGPLHVGNGWLGSYGDALARIMSRCGWKVEREYYVNDTGGQIRALGRSILALRRGEEVPEEGYRGSYVADLAAGYGGADSAGEGEPPLDQDVVAAGRWASERILAQIRSTLESLGIHYDNWYSQAEIEEGGALKETMAAFDAAGLLYEQDGAVMLRTTDLGDVRDRVMRKSADKGGDYTYLAGDLAYHRDKFLVRHFDRVIDVFGADHHGQVASLRAGVAALGVDPSRLEVRLGQMVSLTEGGEAVKMSKRSGNFVALHELIEELGPGPTRLLSLVSSIDQATTVDLAVVRSQSAESPVFYVQYAHARIAAIGRVSAERGIARVPLAEARLDLLVHERELLLLASLEALPEVVRIAAAERAPHRVTAWVRDLAARFHGFYHDCRVMGEGVPPELTQARLWLVEATRIGLRIGLSLLGVEAPEVMEPSEPAAEVAR